MSYIDAKMFPGVFQHVRDEDYEDFCKAIEVAVMSVYDDVSSEADLFAQNFSYIASCVKPKYIGEHSYVYAARHMKELVVFVYI